MSGRYKTMVATLVDFVVEDPAALMTMTEAAELLEISLPTLNAGVNRGTFKTVVFDMLSPSPQRGRRLLVREEVLDYAAKRGERRRKGSGSAADG